ncbi:MAG: acyltransferase, partial [Microthrixaceae bacterium]|nr:acyltransferase [Microthrixaceae bacterium]
EYLPSGPDQFNRPDMLDHMYWFRFGHTLGALGFGLMVIGMARYGDWWFARMVSWKPLQWTGRLSYTLYIWHALPFLIIASVMGGSDASLKVELLRTPIMIAAAIAVSMPVYYKVELPVLKAKLRFASEKEALDLRTGKMVNVEEHLAAEAAAKDKSASTD